MKSEESKIDESQSNTAEEIKDEKSLAEQKFNAAIKKLNDNAREEDATPSSRITFREILGGNMLSARWIRSQIWLMLLIVLFTFAYVAFRYQCQQDMIQINKLKTSLKDAKYKALSTSSELTERCRESHILKMLKQQNDSLLKTSDKPPYIIYVSEE
ncbi:MAG: FtsL-like putative cell division protein [Prevotella sp.]|nr:FtsL-like putative cell division protein [Prevotella sp.]